MLFLFGLAGCDQGTRTSTTKGAVRVECDESLEPVMQLQAEDFQRTYTEASVTLRFVGAREAIADFSIDSVRVIVSARPFNTEELDFMKAAKIEYQEFKVALDAIAVIGHKNNTLKQLRLSELDSIFSGAMTRWPVKSRNNIIDPVIADVNSSINETFQGTVLQGKPFALTAMRMPTSEKLIEYVRSIGNAIGIVGLSWLKGHEQHLTVFSLASANTHSDSAQPSGKYYSPEQAYVLTKEYPIIRPVYMYTREVRRDVGLGFISYVSSAQGQKIFLNNGLVPATMPVRLVELSSQQVKQ